MFLFIHFISLFSIALFFSSNLSFLYLLNNLCFASSAIKEKGLTPLDFANLWSSKYLELNSCIRLFDAIAASEAFSKFSLVIN